MTEYNLSKFFFEMKDPALRREFSADPEATMTRFKVSEASRSAVIARDVAFLAQKVNPYLLRYFCGYIGMPEQEFLAKIRAPAAASLAVNHG